MGSMQQFSYSMGTKSLQHIIHGALYLRTYRIYVLVSFLDTSYIYKQGLLKVIKGSQRVTTAIKLGYTHIEGVYV